MTEKGEVEVAYVDGYSFGDTLLEGVLFEVRVKNDQLVCEAHHESADTYLKRFNSAQVKDWYADALRVAVVDGDGLVTANRHGHGEEDVWVED